jgi:hypothetical protein
MLLALLLSGPTPAAAMPCCNGQALVKVQQDDAMADMPACHHAAASLHCTHGVCAQAQHEAPVSEAVPLNADTATTPLLVQSRIPQLIAGHPATPRALPAPSPPTAMPLLLRV